MTHYNSFLTVWSLLHEFYFNSTPNQSSLDESFSCGCSSSSFYYRVLLYLITFICLPLQTVIAVLGSHFHICQACQTVCVWSELVVDLLLL